MFRWIAYIFRSIFGTAKYLTPKIVHSVNKPKASNIVPMEYNPKIGFGRPDVIPIYCFIYDTHKRKYYGIRHFQGFEYIGWRRIPISELGPSSYYEYNMMGMKIQKDAIEYKRGDPQRMVFGYAYNSPQGKIMAMTWNEKKKKIEPVDAETTIDVKDPMQHTWW